MRAAAAAASLARITGSLSIPFPINSRPPPFALARGGRARDSHKHSPERNFTHRPRVLCAYLSLFRRRNVPSLLSPKKREASAREKKELSASRACVYDVHRAVTHMYVGIHARTREGRFEPRVAVISPFASAGRAGGGQGRPDRGRAPPEPAEPRRSTAALLPPPRRARAQSLESALHVHTTRPRALFLVPSRPTRPSARSAHTDVSHDEPSANDKRVRQPVSSACACVIRAGPSSISQRCCREQRVYTESQRFAREREKRARAIEAAERRGAASPAPTTRLPSRRRLRHLRAVCSALRGIFVAGARRPIYCALALLFPRARVREGKTLDWKPTSARVLLVERDEWQWEGSRERKSALVKRDCVFTPTRRTHAQCALTRTEQVDCRLRVNTGADKRPVRSSVRSGKPGAFQVPPGFYALQTSAACALRRCHVYSSRAAESAPLKTPE